MIEEIIRGLPAVLVSLLLTLGIVGYIGLFVLLFTSYSKSKRIVGYTLAIVGLIVGILFLSWAVGSD